jgi:hypothetical protein
MGNGRVAAKGIRNLGQAPDALSPQGIAAEVGESIERILRSYKASAIAAALDRSRSTVYEWAADPDKVPPSKLAALAALDPDPEFLTRCAAHLLAESAALAARRRALGQSTVLVRSFRRAMQQAPLFGDEP